MYRSRLVLPFVVVLAGAFLATATGARFLANGHPDVVVNEIMVWTVHPDSVEYELEPWESHQWIELYNADSADADVDGWLLGPRNGTPMDPLPIPVPVPPEACLVVHYTTGTDDFDFSDGAGHVYLGDAAPFDPLGDEVGLFAGAPSSASIVDFVSFAHDTTFVEGTLFAHAVAAGIWSPGDYLPLSGRSPGDSADTFYDMVFDQPEGCSVARDSLATDTDSSADFGLLGGVDGLVHTMGTYNYAPFEVVPPPPAKAAPVNRKWLIMYYADMRDPGVRNAAYKNLGELKMKLTNNRQFDVAVFASQVKKPAGGGGRFLLQPGESIGVVGEGEALSGPARNAYDPANLTAFLTWARGQVTATNHCLVILGHGQGWKGTNISGDNQNNFSMDDLRTGIQGGMGGLPANVIILESCNMGMVEVATQIADLGNFAIMSEMPRKTFKIWRPFGDKLLQTNGNWTPMQFAWNFVDLDKGKMDDEAPVTCAVNLAMVPALNTAISNFANQLVSVVEDVQNINVRGDNGQIALYDLRDTDAFECKNPNFVDLYHLARTVSLSGNISIKKARQSALTVMGMLAQPGPTNLMIHRGSKDLNRLRGLSVYFPRKMTQWHRADNKDHPPMDDPWRTEINPSIARYRYCDPTDDSPFDREHVPPDLPNFRFATMTTWDDFLERYFNPVADAVILVDDDPRKSVRLAAGHTSITLTLSGAGSSDIDQYLEQNHRSRKWFWDDDHRENKDSTNRDKDLSDEPDDDGDAEGEQISLLVEVPLDEEFVLVTLNTWDDHYVADAGHFQTDQSTVAVQTHASTMTFGKLTIIDEIFPGSRRIAAATGGWFEIYNNSGGALDLNGWTISDVDGESHVIDAGGPLILGADAYAVMARDSVALAGEGVSVFYEYGDDIVLKETDSLLLTDATGEYRETLFWSQGGVWPGDEGASMQWAGVGTNADGATWFNGHTSFGSGDLGTPGAPNEQVSSVGDGSVPGAGSTLPFRLHPAVPNPFNPQTTIAFDLPERAPVDLRIYDVAGRLVRTLIEGRTAGPGRNEIVWNGRDAGGRHVAAGVYFCRLDAGTRHQTTRMVLMK